MVNSKQIWKSVGIQLDEVLTLINPHSLTCKCWRSHRHRHRRPRPRPRPLPRHPGGPRRGGRGWAPCGGRAWGRRMRRGTCRAGGTPCGGTGGRMPGPGWLWGKRGQKVWVSEGKGKRGKQSAGMGEWVCMSGGECEWICVWGREGKCEKGRRDKGGTVWV